MRIKAFIDTNVLLDYILGYRPSSPAAQSIFSLVKEHSIEAVITSQSLIDASFFVAKDPKGDMAGFIECVRIINDYFNTEQIDSFDILWACRHYSGNFEDDALYARAVDTCCDVFVTNDRKLRERRSGNEDQILFLSPEEFIDKITIRTAR